MNRRSHKAYNDKFRLSVICLSQIDLATEEDRRYQIDEWARLFNATTWEDLKMMGTTDSVFQEAGTVMYEASEDEHMQQITCAPRTSLAPRTGCGPTPGCGPMPD